MLNIKKTTAYIFIIAILSSCKFECKVGKTDKNDTSLETTVKKVGDLTVTNNINITSNTTKLENATLTFSNGERIPDDNVISLNEKIYLELTFSDNNPWKTINGKCSLGASEKITTDDGTVILNAGDLFKDYSEGFDAHKAQVVKLNAVITKQMKPIKYYIVYFKVWDKYSDAELTGNYKFYIKN